MTAPPILPVRRERPPAPPWASGIVTGLETVIMSAGLVLAFAFAAVAAAPSVDGSIAADWSGASDVATSVWLLAHGVPATVGVVAITLIPLGLTLVTVVIAASVARRYAVAAHASVVCAGLAYGAVVGAVALVEHAHSGEAIRAAAIGGVACGVGATLGLKRAHGFRFWEFRLPPSLSSGLRLGVGATALCGAAASVTAVAWLVAGWDRSAAMAAALAPDPVGGVALGVGETAYVPNVVVWAMSWLTGTGFAFGEGSHYSPSAVTAGPMPSVPLVAALPLDHGGVWAAAPVILVLVGVVARLMFRTKLVAGLVVPTVAVLVVGTSGWIACVAAAGSVGGDALRKVGPEPLRTALALAAFVGVGFAIGALLDRIRRVAPTTSGSHSASRSPLPSMPPSAPPPPSGSPPRIEPQRLW